jgi:3alpha(or 20beta)-hydroxysteroid dehydrogenase
MVVLRPPDSVSPATRDTSPMPDNPSGRLAGKIAIVTGAARGQGEAEARRFATEGARIVLVDVLDAEVKTVAQEICERHGDGVATAVVADISSDAGWETVVRTATETYGGIDILVNNAAIYWTRPLLDEPISDVQRILDVNLLGALRGIQAVVPAMRRRGGGSIVNIASYAGIMAIHSHGAYGMTKWALRGLTKTAAIEHGVDGIRVNAILPGSIKTAMLPVPDEEIPNRFGDVPLGRVGTSEEVAEAVLFLASDESSYLTGSELHVDGGINSGRRPVAPRTAGSD